MKVYMCKTDYDYHIPDDINGVDIYFSLADIKKARLCTNDCGIVELDLEISKIIQEPNKFKDWSTLNLKDVEEE